LAQDPLATPDGLVYTALGFGLCAVFVFTTQWVAACGTKADAPVGGRYDYALPGDASASDMLSAYADSTYIGRS
jgi:hypothetical protein